MPASEGFSDFVQGRFRVLPGQIHGDLAREGYIRIAPFAGQVRRPNTKIFRHLLLNPLNRKRLSWYLPTKDLAAGAPLFLSNTLAY